MLECNNDRAKWCERWDERVRKWWEWRMQVGGIDLYQPDEGREGGTRETTARFSQTCRDQAQAQLELRAR